MMKKHGNFTEFIYLEWTESPLGSSSSICSKKSHGGIGATTTILFFRGTAAAAEQQLLLLYAYGYNTMHTSALG